MSEAEFTDLPPAYRAAVNTIKNIIDGGEALITARELPEGAGSKVGMEKYAREYCKLHSSMDLGISYSILGVVMCTAAQGGFVVYAPIAGGGILKVPAIQMVLGIAPSGWGKSTALDAGMQPLHIALMEGINDRWEMLPKLKQAAMDAFARHPDRAVDNLVPNEEQFKFIYDQGGCPKTLTEDATQEALRNQAVANGGHVAAIAGEPDLLKNVGHYSNGQGSLTLFLNLWDQRDINTTRVSNTDLFIQEASLAMAILFQTAVFAEVTSGNNGGMGAGGDSYTERGVFGRAFVVETDKTGDFVEMARSYSDDADLVLDPYDVSGYMVNGRMTELGSAALDFEDALRTAQRDTNDYRMSKALNRAWDMAAAKYGTDLQVPRPERLDRTVIHLDKDALREYYRVQRMMAELKFYIDQHEDEENKTLWNPMAARVVQHVLREALVMSLAANRREVTAEFIEDAACRIFPWRWCMSANALSRRTLERAEDILTDAVLNYNPQQKEITTTSMIAKILEDLATEDTSLRSTGYSLTKLRQKVSGKLHRSHRSAASALLKTALAELCADPVSGVERFPGPKNATGVSADYYRVKGTVILR